MTAKQASRFATAMLHGLPRATAERLHPMALKKVKRMDKDLRRAFGKASHECEGKNQHEIGDILGRAIDGVMSVEIDLIELEFL